LLKAIITAGPGRNYVRSRPAQESVDQHSVLERYNCWRESRGVSNDGINDFACRADLITFRDFRLDKEAGRKTVANDFGTLSEFFKWCVREHHLNVPGINATDTRRFWRRLRRWFHKTLADRTSNQRVAADARVPS
jgi:hypothetical protein